MIRSRYKILVILTTAAIVVLFYQNCGQSNIDAVRSTSSATFVGLESSGVAGRATDYIELGAMNIGGLDLGPATYKWRSAVTINSDLGLADGPNDVWIFQVAQGLSISSGVKIIYAIGTLAQNIYWQAFSAAELETTSILKAQSCRRLRS